MIEDGIIRDRTKKGRGIIEGMRDAWIIKGGIMNGVILKGRITVEGIIRKGDYV
jgi:hypothetical protein